MIERAVRHRKIVFFFLAAILIGGIASYFVVAKQEAPDINPPVTRITAIYPGASQANVESFVTAKIEETLMDMEAYDYATSYTYDSVTTIICFMKYGYDADEVWVELRRKMAELQSQLPAEVLPIDVNTNMIETAGMIIGLSGDYDYDGLGFYGSTIVEELKKVDGITRFEMIGDVGKEVRITVDAKKMNRLNMSYEEMNRMLKGQNLEIPSGTVKTEGEDIPLRIKGSFSNLEDIRNLILDVSTDNYSVLKLKDIATVAMVEEDAQVVYRHNGRQAVLLVGYFEKNRNVLDVGKDVRDTINGIKVHLPSDLVFDEVVFQPQEVDKAINGFLWNLLIGIVLVIVVVFVGMGFRNAIIVSLAIPTSILSTLLLMPIFDIKIHAISITAFIVALGMLVDNAIVVSDAIQNKLDAGTERLEACVEGTKEVIVSILTSTLTTVAAFSPLMLLNSIAVDYVKALPQVVVISLTASFLFAFIVTPSLAYVFFKAKAYKSPEERQTWMQHLLALGLKRKFLAFALGLVVIGLLGSSFLHLNIIFFPKTDKTIMYIDVKADKNIDAAYTKAVTDQIETILKGDSAVVSYTTAIGGSLPKYYDTLGVYAEIPENAQVVMNVDLTGTPYIKNSDYAKDLQRRIDGSLHGGKATVKELEYAEPISAPIHIRVAGDDMDRLWAVAGELQAILEEVPGSSNVRTDYTPYTYVYEVDLDDRTLSHYGLMKYDVLNEVSIALSGRNAGVFRFNNEEYPIRLVSDLKTTENVGNLMIKSTATGNKHLLKDLGTTSLLKSRPTIKKYNGEMTIVLMSDLDRGYDSGTVEKAFASRVAHMDFGDVTLIFDGESSKIGQYFGNFVYTAAFAIISIFGILLIQFRTYRQALIVLLSLPLSASGAVFGLFVMDQPVSFTGAIGIISLIGIVVNNAIVLMEFINMERQQGKGVDEAAIHASVTRFRPIMLSTVTTVIGLLPLMLSNSELFKPMSVTLVFGLLVSTFLTLVFIPLTYSVVYHNEI